MRTIDELASVSRRALVGELAARDTTIGRLRSENSRLQARIGNQRAVYRRFAKTIQTALAKATERHPSEDHP
jgi:hypothetical protein